MIQFTCACGSRLEVDDQGAGQAVNCPDCGQPVQVPPAAPPPPADIPVAALNYASPIFNRPQPPPTPSPLAWQVASLLMAVNLVSSIASWSVLYQQSPKVAEAAAPMIFVGAAIAAAIALGLYLRADWARWAALILAAIGATGMFISAASTKRSPFPGALAIVSISAIMVLVGWILVLDRPGSRTKVTAGAAMISINLAVHWLLTLAGAM